MVCFKDFFTGSAGSDEPWFFDSSSFYPDNHPRVDCTPLVASTAGIESGNFLATSAVALAAAVVLVYLRAAGPILLFTFSAWFASGSLSCIGISVVGSGVGPPVMTPFLHELSLVILAATSSFKASYFALASASAVVFSTHLASAAASILAAISALVSLAGVAGEAASVVFLLLLLLVANDATGVVAFAAAASVAAGVAVAVAFAAAVVFEAAVVFAAAVALAAVVALVEAVVLAATVLFAAGSVALAAGEATGVVLEYLRATGPTFPLISVP